MDCNSDCDTCPCLYVLVGEIKFIVNNIEIATAAVGPTELLSINNELMLNDLLCAAATLQELGLFCNSTCYC